MRNHHRHTYMLVHQDDKVKFIYMCPCGAEKIYARDSEGNWHCEISQKGLNSVIPECDLPRVVRRILRE